MKNYKKIDDRTEEAIRGLLATRFHMSHRKIQYGVEPTEDRPISFIVFNHKSIKNNQERKFMNDVFVKHFLKNGNVANKFFFIDFTYNYLTGEAKSNMTNLRTCYNNSEKIFKDVQKQIEKRVRFKNPVIPNQEQIDVLEEEKEF